ncbi:MAG TPA: hypothetical protein DCE78_04935 [Bacteroidetes bacterium]|jgi:hypothetical protein|nr:hypothetical protein [Bacteroidota bacterium]
MEKKTNRKCEYETVVNGLNHEKYTEIFDTDRKEKENGFKWCLHCNRAYLIGNFRYNKHDLDETVAMLCPYDDCDGDYWMDGWGWSDIAHSNDYPSIPETGKIYSLYPEK